VRGSNLSKGAGVMGTGSTGVMGVGADYGVLGQSPSKSFSGYGVCGTHAGSGAGVYGTCPGGNGVGGSSSLGTGVYGASTEGYGVFATTASSGINPNGTYGAAVIGWHTGTASGFGVQGSKNGNGYGVYGDSETGFGVAGRIFAASGDWAVFGFGNIGATGTIAQGVPSPDGSVRKVYSVGSPESWLEDFGSGTLVSGSARVQIDPAFASAVATDAYHVFLTPLGDCRGLYVSQMDAAGFTVHELQHGQSSLTFSYRVVARRSDVTAPRFARVTLPVAPTTQATAAVHPPAAMPPLPTVPPT
jgi:hypothetical protein